MLSDRDKLILDHLCAGKRDKEIARELGSNRF
jgi:DNA-binding NarL/FixJ family response regulator